MKIVLNKVVLMLAAFLMLAVSSAEAQESLRSPLLKKFEETGGSVDFIGSSHGMDGWVVKDAKGDVKNVVYTLSDGSMLSGPLFAADGTNETKDQLEQYHQRITGSQAAAPGAKDSSSKSEKLYAEVEKANWVAVGKDTAPFIYVFMNVTCDHCQAYWKDLEKAVDAGTLQLRLVPYGSQAENRDGGAALLAADKPDEAWKAYVAGNAAVLSKDKATEGGYKKLDDNTALVKSWKIGPPPFTLYRRPGDGTLAAIVGRPDNVMLLLAEFLK